MNRILDKCANAARCPNLRKEMENVNMELFLAVQQWLRTHGKVQQQADRALLAQQVFDGWDCLETAMLSYRIRDRSSRMSRKRS